ncbi:rhodanese-like domain-containing protein [Paenibacillus abyssi]|uniref:Rhodanese n=1 Tax=Paenibacillus abyssi TaxID=1340531 RepID=A0A917CG04_9BACL|nr:rhodanese-like domain-containing protein [Paenibacillus abyssi]GGF87630.1 rhodanese [Paenibacillus abyssi]
MMETWEEIDARSLLNGLKNGDIKPEQIIDVREQMEWDYYHLEGTTLIPMNTIPLHQSELHSDLPLYIICAHGVRSAAVCDYLYGQGHSGIHNVSGGMAAVALVEGFQYD